MDLDMKSAIGHGIGHNGSHLETGSAFLPQLWYRGSWCLSIRNSANLESVHSASENSVFLGSNSPTVSRMPADLTPGNSGNAHWVLRSLICFLFLVRRSLAMQIVAKAALPGDHHFWGLRQYAELQFQQPERFPPLE